MAEQFERLREHALYPKHPARSPLFSGRAFVFVIACVVVFLFVVWQGTRLLAQPEVIPFGREHAIYPFIYSVQRVETSTAVGTGLLGRAARGVYKNVTISVRNENSKRHAIAQDIVSVVDAAGQEYYPLCRSDLGSCVELPKTFTQNFLDPDEEVLGVFVFDVPAEATGFKLKILTDVFSGAFVLFDLD
jgi:hypothetical protein